jgi:hypothetical protein
MISLPKTDAKPLMQYFPDPKKPPNNNKLIIVLLIGGIILYKIKN